MSSFIGIRNKNIHLRYSLNRHRCNRDDKPGDTAMVAALRLKKHRSVTNRLIKFKNAKNGYATLQRYVKWCKRLYSLISVQKKYLSLYRTDVTQKPGRPNVKRVAIFETVAIH